MVGRDNIYRYTHTFSFPQPDESILSFLLPPASAVEVKESVLSMFLSVRVSVCQLSHG